MAAGTSSSTGMREVAGVVYAYWAYVWWLHCLCSPSPQADFWSRWAWQRFPHAAFGFLPALFLSTDSSSPQLAGSTFLKNKLQFFYFWVCVYVSLPTLFPLFLLPPLHPSFQKLSVSKVGSENKISAVQYVLLCLFLCSSITSRSNDQSEWALLTCGLSFLSLSPSLPPYNYGRWTYSTCTREYNNVPLQKNKRKYKELNEQFLS